MCTAGKPVGHGHRQNVDQRIAHFEITLATGYVSDTTPGWNQEVARWVVYDLAYFPRCYRQPRCWHPRVPRQDRPQFQLPGITK